MYFSCHVCNLIIVESSFCPYCDQDRQNRWKDDTFIIYHSEMAEGRGLLVGNDISDIQAATIAFNMARKNIKEGKKEDAKWEWDFQLYQPEMYKKWKEDQKLNEYVDGHQIEYYAPQNLEEAASAIAVLDSLDRQLNSQTEQNVNLNQKTNFMGIDLDKIGDEE
jgi:RNA polymerase subunit RPABC4/transcription elongation factor Spt4